MDSKKPMAKSKKDLKKQYLKKKGVGMVMPKPKMPKMPSATTPKAPSAQSAAPKAPKPPKPPKMGLGKEEESMEKVQKPRMRSRGLPKGKKFPSRGRWAKLKRSEVSEQERELIKQEIFEHYRPMYHDIQELIKTAPLMALGLLPVKKKQGVPEGVDPDKMESCVRDVKGQKGVNPYAVCSSSLQGKTKKAEMDKCGDMTVKKWSKEEMDKCGDITKEEIMEEYTPKWFVPKKGVNDGANQPKPKSKNQPKDEGSGGEIKKKDIPANKEIKPKDHC